MYTYIHTHTHAYIHSLCAQSLSAGDRELEVSYGGVFYKEPNGDPVVREQSCMHACMKFVFGWLFSVFRGHVFLCLEDMFFCV